MKNKDLFRVAFKNQSGKWSSEYIWAVSYWSAFDWAESKCRNREYKVERQPDIDKVRSALGLNEFAKIKSI